MEDISVRIAADFKTERCNCLLIINNTGVESLYIDNSSEKGYKDFIAEKYKDIVTLAKDTDPLIKAIVLDLKRYFGGRMISFDKYRLDLSHCSTFAYKAYMATKKVPFGETRSYKWISNEIKRPLSYRAVGKALSRNKHPVFIPCHRVIKEDGSLGGFFGGKKNSLKASLLKLEHRFFIVFVLFSICR